MIAKDQLIELLIEFGNHLQGRFKAEMATLETSLLARVTELEKASVIEVNIEPIVKECLDELATRIPPKTEPMVTTLKLDASELEAAIKEGIASLEGDIKGMVNDAVAAVKLPDPIDPTPLIKEAVAALELPQPADGRDAVHIEILPAIDIERSYPRGTYAKHAGGLWRSFEGTQAMRGWECIVEGVQSLEIEQVDPRSLEVRSVLSSGVENIQRMSLPVMIYKGVYRQGQEYAQGDAVTWDGSTWHCNAATIDRPGSGSEDWQLMVKVGRKGDRGDPGKPGEPGKPGVNGKDLTQLGADGSKW